MREDVGRWVEFADGFEYLLAAAHADKPIVDYCDPHQYVPLAVISTGTVFAMILMSFQNDQFST
jgi:hypothetical protein